MRQAHTTPRKPKDAPKAGPTIPSRPLPPENPAERPEGLHLSSPLRHDSGLSNPLRRYLSRQRGSLLPFSATRRFQYRAYPSPIIHSRRRLHALRTLYPSPHTSQRPPRATEPTKRVLRRSYNLFYLYHHNKNLPKHPKINTKTSPSCPTYPKNHLRSLPIPTKSPHHTTQRLRLRHEIYISHLIPITSR